MPGFTVLVPLDTTELSETSFRILPMLKTIGFEKVRLISVLDDKQKNGADERARNSYLEERAARVREMGFEASTELRRGNATDAVLEATAADDVDLLLIATHGRTGLARLRLGSVADKLIKESPRPRLVVGPNVNIDLTGYALRRILVPLDGTELAELSLPIAKHLAAKSGAQIDLLRAVSITPVAHDPTMAGVDILAMVTDEARDYLARTAASLEGQGHKVSTTLLMGSASEGILEHVKENPVDLVIMASRGRTGLARAAMGSVTERVLQGPDPVLVFEPGEDHSRLFLEAREAAG
jgi:nucleotide-binding universal stress UspA family protein